MLPQQNDAFLVEDKGLSIYIFNAMTADYLAVQGAGTSAAM